MIAYGALCSWWSEKENVSTLPSGIPCCPYCKGVLFEMKESQWESNLERYIKETGDVSYRDYVEQLKNRCCF